MLALEGIPVSVAFHACVDEVTPNLTRTQIHEHARVYRKHVNMSPPKTITSYFEILPTIHPSIMNKLAVAH